MTTTVAPTTTCTPISRNLHDSAESLEEEDDDDENNLDEEENVFNPGATGSSSSSSLTSSYKQFIYISIFSSVALNAYKFSNF